MSEKYWGADDSDKECQENPPPAKAFDEGNAEGERQEGEQGAHVRLQQDENERWRENESCEQPWLNDAVSPARPCDGPGHEQQCGRFGEFRRLDGQAADADPALRTIDGLAASQDPYEQNEFQCIKNP